MFRTDRSANLFARSRADRCRRHVLICIIALLAAAMPWQSASAGDPVAAFLERHGMREELARHLEWRIEHADDDEREALILQLADIYALMLEEQRDPTQRIVLEQRSRRLLEFAPKESADELRLVLLRNAYRSAERIAENHRLRMADKDDIKRARHQLEEIIPALAALSNQLDRSVANLQRRVSRAGRAEASGLNDRLNQQSRTLLQSRYLHAWSLYYMAYLSDGKQTDHARQAQRIFAELLMTESAHPRPDEVSVDLRRMEPLTRSIVGMALCQSLTASWSSAISWMDLLTHPNTAAEVKPLIDGWRILIYLEHAQYGLALDVLRAAVKKEDRVPTSWLRLAAVGSLESEESTGRTKSNELAKFAMTQLASRGELQQALDLAERYGTAALGDSGFAARYIEGLVHYRAARDQHGKDTPTTDPPLQKQYLAARQAFESALSERDAEDYPEASQSIEMLIAWSFFYADDLRNAADHFERISRERADTDGETALWMAIVSMDRLIQRREEKELRSRMTRLTERFLDSYPDSRYSPTLLVNQSLRSEDLTADDVERLLSIPSEHEAHGPAQRRAVLALYRSFRGASDRNRVDHAYRFLSVSIPLLDELHSAESNEGSQDVRRVVFLIRQILEVALHTDVRRAADARQAINTLDSLDQSHQAVREYLDEIRFRRVQLALLEDDVNEAEVHAEQLWKQDYRSQESRLASRSMFQHAERLWHGAADEDLRETAAAMVIRHGGRVLREFEDEDDPLDSSVAGVVARVVAEASMMKWQRSGESEHGRIALFLTHGLLERNPTQRSLLRQFGILAEAFDRPHESLDAWRRLVAGSEQGSEQWYEARYHQLRLLTELDPPRAVRLMRQHHRLYPDFGPEPWGEKFRLLSEQLNDS